MKTAFKISNYLPAGWDWDNLRFGLGLGHLASTVPLVSFLTRYGEAKDSLYEHYLVNGKWIKELVPSRVMPAFSRLVLGFPLLGFWVFFLCMALQVARHYRYHTQGAMSIYLMKRLPDRWELHRRCWTVPVLASLGELALMGLMVFLCWLLYRYATPEGCLP